MLETLEVHEVRPYRDRSYEWVRATATNAVDPEDPANGRIVDLDRAPRHGDGMVRFRFDVRLLRPNRAANGRALLVVPNRGMLGGVPFSLDAQPAVGPTEDPDPGDGFLLERGWTLAWAGWQWDVHRDKGWLGIDAPRADLGPGPVRVEFRSDTALAEHRLSDSSALFDYTDYPPVDLEDPQALLSVRTSELGEKRVVPRTAWRFLDEHRFTVDGGFQPFHWYELVYASPLAPVVGTGLLAVRDLGAWLAQDHDWRLAFGISQSGRFLRQFLFEGLNLDEAQKQVFDGIFTHLGGARRGEFNQRRGQPGLTHPLCPGYGPPYDTAGLLERQGRLGGVPKLLATNSASEYWRGDGALLHQDARTGEDLPEPPGTRTHLLSGTDHYGPFALKAFLPAANPVHLLDPSPLLRALFVQLEQWVCHGIEPPPSRVPRQEQGSITSREAVLAPMAGAHRPDPAFLPVTPAIDPASTAWPLELGEPMVALVSAIDEGGNEVAGIRLPALDAGLFAYTGWNPRVAVEGLPDVLLEFVGSRLPLRGHPGGPERSDYEARVRQAAAALVADGFLRSEDLERVVAATLAAYEEALPAR